MSFLVDVELDCLHSRQWDCSFGVEVLFSGICSYGDLSRRGDDCDPLALE